MPGLLHHVLQHLRVDALEVWVWALGLAWSAHQGPRIRTNVHWVDACSGMFLPGQ